MSRISPSLSTSVEDLRDVLAADFKACGLPPRWKWRYIVTRRLVYFQVVLRVAEWLRGSTGRSPRFAYLLVRLKLESLGERLGFDIPIGVFGKGLSIAHRGYIVVNGDARVGQNCRIHHGVTIGSVNGLSPRIGDNVFLGPGAGLYGGIVVGSGCTIGPNALVNFDVPPNSRVVAARGKLQERAGPWVPPWLNNQIDDGMQ